MLLRDAGSGRPPPCRLVLLPCRARFYFKLALA
jgi:hypothetical protein